MTGTAEHTTTDTQRAVFAFVRDQTAAQGYGLTVREICVNFKWRSPNAAWSHLKALSRAGLVTWTPGVARTIRPSGGAL